ncbi:MAG: hypothetical protein HQ595_04330 [Candidatus Omnitrophica bacterium]|nr:hypothetical protein [Candidatus Omnitrophota bacterium]
MRKLYIFGLIALTGIIIGFAWAEQITMTTYYPAPHGVYQTLQADVVSLVPSAGPPAAAAAPTMGMVYFEDGGGGVPMGLYYYSGVAWVPGGGGGSSWIHDGSLVAGGISISSASWDTLDLSAVIGQERVLVLLRVQPVNLQGNFCAKTYGIPGVPGNPVFGAVDSTGTLNSANGHVGTVIVETDALGRVQIMAPLTVPAVNYNIWLMGYISG